MLNNISCLKYIPIDSNVHAMHPLSKIICTFIFLLMLVLANNIEMVGILVILMMIMIISSNISFNVYQEFVKNLKLLFLFIFLLCSLVSLSFTFGFVILIKSILFVISLTLLSLTTPTTEIIYGLEKFLYPLNRFNIKSNKWALNISMALRFIPTIIDKRNNILKSQISRGIDYRLGFYNFLISMKGMIIPAFNLAIKSLRNSKELMVVRLYGYSNVRCNFRINKWGLFDNYILFIHGLALLMMILKGVIL